MFMPSGLGILLKIAHSWKVVGFPRGPSEVSRIEQTRLHIFRTLEVDWELELHAN